MDCGPGTPSWPARNTIADIEAHLMLALALIPEVEQLFDECEMLPLSARCPDQRWVAKACIHSKNALLRSEAEAIGIQIALVGEQLAILCYQRIRSRQYRHLG